MSYRVLRNESRNSPRDGSPEVFIHLEIQDDALGLFYRAEWLTPAEVATLANDTDGSILDSIATAIQNRALLARPAQIVQEQQSHELELARQQNEAAQAQLQLAQVQLDQTKAELQISQLQAGLQLE